MQAIDRVKALHLKEGAAQICDDCIAVNAKLSSRQQSNVISRNLISTSQLVRRKDSCSVCGDIKYVMLHPKATSGHKEISASLPREKKDMKKQDKHIPASRGIKNLNKLLEIGFVSIGYWQNNNGSPKLVQIDLHDASPALYAFVENEQVLYVGKTSQTLKKRLYFYGRPGSTQKTNIRINNNLKNALSSDRTIDMYGYTDVRPIKVGIFDLNFAAALEDSIINTLSPTWNMQGT